MQLPHICSLPYITCIAGRLLRFGGYTLYLLQLDSTRFAVWFYAVGTTLVVMLRGAAARYMDPHARTFSYTYAVELTPDSWLALPNRHSSTCTPVPDYRGSAAIQFCNIFRLPPLPQRRCAVLTPAPRLKLHTTTRQRTAGSLRTPVSMDQHVLNAWMPAFPVRLKPRRMPPCTCRCGRTVRTT